MNEAMCWAMGRKSLTAMICIGFGTSFSWLIDAVAPVVVCAARLANVRPRPFSFGCLMFCV